MDISKCTNDKCTIKETCIRHTVKPNEYEQSYTLFEQNKDGSCDFKLGQNGIK